MNIKENVKNTDIWIRGLFILVYGVIFYFLLGLIWLVVIFQFFTKLITTELNQQLLRFSDSLNRYVAQILHYIMFKSEERPFPFSQWPTQPENEGYEKEALKADNRKNSNKKTSKQDQKDDNDG